MSQSEGVAEAGMQSPCTSTQRHCLLLVSTSGEITPRVNARSLSTPLGVAGPAAAVCGHQGDPQGRYPTCFMWPCLLLR